MKQIEFYSVLCLKLKMKTKRINFLLFFLGLLFISAFIVSSYFTLTDRNIRLNGELIKAEVVAIEGRISRPIGSATVKIGKKTFDAGSINSNVSIGDSILVRYIPNAYCVVQDSVDPKRYYLFLFLEFILIIIGFVLIKESLKGISTWEYLTKY